MENSIFRQIMQDMKKYYLILNFQNAEKKTLF